MFTLSDDPVTFQREARKAYLLKQQGLITDKEFADVVSESLRKTTSFSDRELARAE